MFVSRVAATGHVVPRFCEREAAAFLRCGILAHGLARVHCDDCGEDDVVGCRKSKQRPGPPGAHLDTIPACELRLLGALRPRQRRPRPAGLRRARIGQDRSGRRIVVVVERLPARDAPGRRAAHEGRTGALRARPRRRRPRRACAHDRARERSEPAASARDRRSRDRGPHRRLRARVPHADQRAGARRRAERARGSARALWHRARQERIREQLPARAAARRARRALRAAASPRLGPPRQRRQRRPAARVAEHVPADRPRRDSARARPRTPRVARRDARRVGRRVGNRRTETRRVHWVTVRSALLSDRPCTEAASRIANCM